jgi:hypothetical protein
VIQNAPTVDAVPREEHESLLKRFRHLLESDFIRSFDEYDPKTGTYKRDISEADVIRIIPIETHLPKWISVEDRLPEKSGRYLVAINCPKGRWGECNSYDHLKQRWSSEWDCFHEDTTELVTHWMSLPDPPKMSQE